MALDVIIQVCVSAVNCLRHHTHQARLYNALCSMKAALNTGKAWSPGGQRSVDIRWGKSFVTGQVGLIRTLEAKCTWFHVSTTLAQ